MNDNRFVPQVLELGIESVGISISSNLCISGTDTVMNPAGMFRALAQSRRSCRRFQANTTIPAATVRDILESTLVRDLILLRADLSPSFDSQHPEPILTCLNS